MFDTNQTKMNTNLFHYLVYGILVISQSLSAAIAADRVALVIGNSKYEHLGTLPNTLNDAQSMSKSLKEMGYETTTLIDASDVAFRRELRNFSLKSSNASIAVVFYAGHGAQVNGENYLLPVDVEAPKRESDIRLSSIKVDDVINSIQAKTKVIFLDACRDNPALLKSLASGRGAYRGGLAPANGSSFESGGSGVFIAYATDAGSVALDSIGKENSPFTTALLTHMKKPMSIDDMFSMVTRDVRQSTKNAQRPYKYASLDGVICLSATCRPEGAPRPSDKAEIKSEGSWVLFQIQGEPREFVYYDPSTIRQVRDRWVAQIKWEKPKDVAEISKSEEAIVRIQTYVTNCGFGIGALADSKEINNKGVVLKDLSFGAPEITTLVQSVQDPSSIGGTLNRILCSEQNRDPIVSLQKINSSEWRRLFTIDFENGTDYHYLPTSLSDGIDYKEVTVKIEYKKGIALSEIRATYPSAKQGSPLITKMIIRNRFYCKDRKYFVLRENFIQLGNEWVGTNIYLSPEDDSPLPMTDTGQLGKFFDFICTIN
jgi:hypothetical protein